MMTKAPLFYTYFAGQGLELLRLELDDPNPFTLPAAKIVERVLAAGFKPDLEHQEREPYHTADALSVIEREGQTFLVSVDIEGETIAVQEQRMKAYGAE